MLRLLARLFLFLAVLVAPLGMTATPAAAAHHAASAGMPMEHCPEQDQKRKDGGIVECTMGCAAALPVLHRAAGAQLRIAQGADALPVAPRLAGVLHEIATPPPKSI